MSLPEPELRLLLEQHRLLPQPRRAQAAAGSLVVHCLMAALALVVPPPPTRFHVPREVTYQSTPLVAPPLRLTERSPNKGQASNEVNLAGLLARRQSIPAPPAPSSPALAAAPLETPVPSAILTPK